MPSHIIDGYHNIAGIRYVIRYPCLGVERIRIIRQAATSSSDAALPKRFQATQWRADISENRRFSHVDSQVGTLTSQGQASRASPDPRASTPHNLTAQHPQDQDSLSTRVRSSASTVASLLTSVRGSTISSPLCSNAVRHECRIHPHPQLHLH